MRRPFSRRSFTAVTIGALAFALLAETPIHNPSRASSHREAPLITKDPLADNTDVYAFRSTEPGREGFVTLMANFIPFQEPSGGPHFYMFDDTVFYSINIDNTGDGYPDIEYAFVFFNQTKNPDTILGMAAPNEALQGTGGIEPLITSLTDPDYNEAQTYNVYRFDDDGFKVVASGLITPPNNMGERTTPNYEALAQQAVYALPNGGRAFAGQRDEGFYIDLGGAFDTLNLRSIMDTDGVDGLSGFNVNTIAIEVPISALTRNGSRPNLTVPSDPNAVVGVWATASRNTTTVIRPNGERIAEGDLVQVSRLGNPLVNELIIPLGLKNNFNALPPAADARFAQFVLNPQLAVLLRAVYGINIPAAPRADLAAIFATGIPAGAVPGAPSFTTFLSDGAPHEMMRLNVAIPPTPGANRSRLGLLGGDPAGYPNGRRVGDDVVDISLRAVAGGTPFTPATNVAPNNSLGDGVNQNDVPYLDRFPYLGTPHSGNTRAGKPHEHHVLR